MSQRTYEAVITGDIQVTDSLSQQRLLTECLEEITQLMAHVEHRLYVEQHIKGRSLNECKSESHKPTPAQDGR